MAGADLVYSVNLNPPVPAASRICWIRQLGFAVANCLQAIGSNRVAFCQHVDDGGGSPLR